MDALAAQEGGLDLLRQPGCFLNSGWDTVAHGDVYVMGLNPGGAPEEFGSIESNILATPDGPWSGYDQSWHAAPGAHRHQVRAKTYIAALNLKHERVLCTNAYFSTTRNAERLREKLSKHSADFSHAFLLYWTAHKLLLSIVQPKLILCFGNSESPSQSSYAAVRSVLNVNGSLRKNTSYRQGKWFTAEAPWNAAKRVHVFGVPHPSRFAATQELLTALRYVAVEARLHSA